MQIDLSKMIMNEPYLEQRSPAGDWSGKRVVVIGAARQGLALASYLARRGAHVVLNDRLPASELSAVREGLTDEKVTWVCGSHPLRILEGADLVCPSGGVPLDLPLIVEARQRGIPLSNDSQIFLEAAPCKVIGITGSAGKTTTTTLVGRIAQAAGRHPESVHPGQVWVGGNIGTPLISLVDEMSPEDLAVMELSSFQLEVMSRSPQVAAVLNITPNHLDRHADMAAYRAAKARILAYQSPPDSAVLNREDAGSWGLAGSVRGKLVSFGRRRPAPGNSGTYLSEDGQSVLLQDSDPSQPPAFIMAAGDISLRGEHNLLNVLAASAIAFAAHLPLQAVGEGVRGFKGVPHRLEFVRTWGGADWYNDSIATAPERSIAAILSFEEPLVLLAGGRDKNLPWDDFARLVEQRVKRLILFGEAAEKIAQVINNLAPASKDRIAYCAGLREAVEVASQSISPGDVVLLAPGGTSFDQFRDFEQRGEAFKKWVMELP